VRPPRALAPIESCVDQFGGAAAAPIFTSHCPLATGAAGKQTSKARVSNRSQMSDKPQRRTEFGFLMV